MYSTYLGGSAYEEGNGIAIDSQGNAYITGTTQSLDFPTQNPIQGTYKGNYDAFIAKLSATGNALLYSTYFGGSNDEYSRAITLDSSGSIYVTGTTASSDFPTQNPFQPSIGSNGNGNAYVLKLNPAGNQLMFSTYFGGSQGEDGNAIGIDVAGQVYIAGATNSPNLPTKNPLQANLRGISDAFIAKFNANGTALIYSTYLGGSQTDYVMGLAVDGTGAAYLTGGTASTDFPVQNPLQPTLAGGGDAYITKINPAGTVLVYSTYLGGSDASNVGSEYGTAIAVDNIGNAYVTGVTSSADFPLANPYQSIFAGHADDAFVTKINSSGNAPLSSNGTGFTVSSKCSV